MAFRFRLPFLPVRLYRGAGPIGAIFRRAGLSFFCRWPPADFLFGEDDLVTFGCHVHVEIEDPDAAAQVLSRARVWLSPLLALSANSPFREGRDAGYASIRTEVFGQWPIAVPPPFFA